MEAEQNFKKEYDEILAIYSKRKSENDKLTKSIPSLENNIANLESQLQKYDSQPSEEFGGVEIAALTAKIHEYQHLVKQVESDIKNDAVEFSSQVSRLKNEQHRLHQHSKANSDVQNVELNKINDELAKIQVGVNNESENIKLVQSELHNNEDFLAKLQAELSRLSETEKHLGLIDHGDNSNSSLQLEVSQYEKALQALQNELKVENQLKKNENGKLEALVKSAKDSFAKEEAEVKQRQLKKQSLQHSLSSNQNEKLNQLQAQIKRLETKNGQIQKDIDNFAQTVDVKKAQKAANQEELKKYKEKKEKNYKQQISEAEKNQESLKKEMDREKEKLADILKLSKSYVSQENLQILQKQLTRHQAVSSKVNFEAEDSKKGKHLKENEVLKSRIQFLRTSSRNLVQQTEGVVRQLKKAGDQLVKDKLAQEKVFNQTTNKLNEYMKEFPDHEKKKELQRLQEKKKKAEQKEKIREAAREEKEKRKLQERKVKAIQQPSSEQKENLTAWEKWDKWEGKNLPSRDETSIFNNRQFQLVIGAVAFLSILFLTFG